MKGILESKRGEKGLSFSLSAWFEQQQIRSQFSLAAPQTGLELLSQRYQLRPNMPLVKRSEYHSSGDPVLSS